MMPLLEKRWREIVKRIVFVTIFAAAMAALASCAIAPARYIDSNAATPSAGKHIVSIERGKQVGANSAALTVYVDGVATADIYGGQAINLYIADGRHIVGVGMFGRTGRHAPEREIAVDVSADSQPMLRAGAVAAGYGGWGIERVNP